jgi:hypothetical protein
MTLLFNDPFPMRNTILLLVDRPTFKRETRITFAVVGIPDNRTVVPLLAATEMGTATDPAEVIVPPTVKLLFTVAFPGTTTLIFPELSPIEIVDPETGFIVFVCKVVFATRTPAKLVVLGFEVAV